MEIKKEDIGWIVDDNHVDGPFYYHVIYPDGDYKQTFCLIDNPMSKKETMVDILPDWEDELENERDGYDSANFKGLYKKKYTKIKEVFYTNLVFYGDVLLYKNKTKYEKYKIWFCKEKKLAQKLLNIIKNKEIRKINVKFEKELKC